MIRFEYKAIPYEFIKTTVDIRKGEKLEEAAKRFEDWLNSYGSEGWEFVGRGENSYCFKRAIQ